jgi:hypothetical protein
MTSRLGQLALIEFAPVSRRNPDVLMVQTAQDRQAENVANRLNTARNRRILAQR